MSKKSCKAAESIEDALLRMAWVNCNILPEYRFLYSARVDSCSSNSPGKILC